MEGDGEFSDICINVVPVWVLHAGGHGQVASIELEALVLAGWGVVVLQLHF